MADNADAYGAFAMVLHDSAVCSRYEIAPLFADTALQRWREITPISPYITLISGDGTIAEYIMERETALALAAKNFITR